MKLPKKAWRLDSELESKVQGLNFAVSGAAFVGLATVVSLDSLDTSLSISLYLFTISMIFGLTAAMKSWLSLLHEAASSQTQLLAMCVGLTAHVTLFFGIFFLLRHVSIPHAVVFGASVILGLAIWFYGGCLTKAARDKLREEE